MGSPAQSRRAVRLPAGVTRKASEVDEANGWFGKRRCGCRGADKVLHSSGKPGDPHASRTGRYTTDRSRRRIVKPDATTSRRGDWGWRRAVAERLLIAFLPDHARRQAPRRRVPCASGVAVGALSGTGPQTILEGPVSTTFTQRGGPPEMGSSPLRWQARPADVTDLIA